MSTPYYTDDQVTLYHGDCLEVLPTLGRRFGGFVTDPPYTAAGGSSTGRSTSADNQFFTHWLRAVCAALRDSMIDQAAGFMFCDWRTIGLVQAAMRSPGERTSGGAWSTAQALVWDRCGIGMGAPFRNTYEMIAFCKGPTWGGGHLAKNLRTIIRHPWPYGEKEFHGAEKPVPLTEQLITWLGLTAVPTPILDPFVGSGTTLLAARNIGRRVVGIEIDEQCCETAAKRLSQPVLDFEGVAS